VLWKVFFFCSRKGAEQQSRKGISFFATPLLCESAAADFFAQRGIFFAACPAALRGESFFGENL
jgi:hypothetical protein